MSTQPHISEPLQNTQLQNTQLQNTQPQNTQPQNVHVPHVVSNAGPEQNTSLALQISAQERRISELTNSLGDRNKQLQKFQTEKKAEMEALMSGVKSWIANLDVKSDVHKEEFTKGLERLVDTSSFDNGVWQVMTCASASAAKQEEMYQTLKTQYDELSQQKQGGTFGSSDNRLGDKRRALEDPSMHDSAPQDIWSAFIADVNQTGYNIM